MFIDMISFQSVDYIVSYVKSVFMIMMMMMIIIIVVVVVFATTVVFGIYIMPWLHVK